MSDNVPLPDAAHLRRPLREFLREILMSAATDPPCTPTRRVSPLPDPRMTVLRNSCPWIHMLHSDAPPIVTAAGTR
jgi:hypothetical protein